MKIDNYDPGVDCLNDKTQSRQSDGLYEKNLVINTNFYNISLLFYLT